MLEIFAVFIVFVLVLFIIVQVLDNKGKKKRGFENDKTEVVPYSKSQQSVQNDEIDYSKDLRDAIREKEERLTNDIKEYRKLFNIPETTGLHYDLYNQARIISSTAINPTSHESEIAYSLVAQNHFFDRRCVFLDSFFRCKNGRYSQVDIIAVNRKGVFVIESKDYSGWIFGNGNQQMWTQSLANKDKYRFYNPIKQNYNHIQCLKGIIGKRIKYYSIIVFGDNAELKNISYIPERAFVATSRRIEEMMSDIMKKEEDCLTAQEIIEVCQLINANKVEPTEAVRNEHIEEIKNTTGKKRVYD